MASRIWNLLLVLLSLAAMVPGQHYRGHYHGSNLHHRVKRQTSDPFVVKSLAVDADSDLPLRREIRDLEKDNERWTLYLLGLNKMHNTNQSDVLSWYQVTGIHGVPFKSWNGVNATKGNEMTGYCLHISVLFPTWHRSYVSLYENILYKIINQIADSWDNAQDRPRYQAAAHNFRVPYWDWAANPPAGDSVFPKSIGGDAFVNVDGPYGRQTIANPLYNYVFNPLNDDDFLETAPWDVWPQTVRAPTTNTTSAQSNNTYVEKVLAANLAGLQQRIYNVFSNGGNYTEFSNAGWIPDLSNAAYDSLESIHDTVHTLAGGLTGHMAYIPFSAFDPIFFLHHANIDRLLAMWQATWPNSWVPNSKAITNSFTTSVGDSENSSSPLTPFYAKPDGTFWSSDMIRDPKVLGYSYAEVAGASLTGGKGNRNLRHVQARVRAAVNRLYGQPSPASLALKWKGEPDVRIPGASLVADGRYREWIANIRVDKQVLGGPFYIHLFLGSVPENSSYWAFADNLVGTMSAFAAPRMKGMEMDGLHISGTVPLTAALKEKVLQDDLASLKVEDVEPYLKQQLKIAVWTAEGKIFEVSEVPTLHIHIASEAVTAPTSEDELPAWEGTGTTHFDIV